jgi:RNA polymerase sigma-70 factor (ECF subfamily)
VGWQRLLQIYGPLVYHWCERTGLNAADSSDVMQDVFLAVSKSIHQFEKTKQSDSFRGWLWTITRNKVRDFCRKQARQIADAAGGTNAYAELAAVSEQLSDDSMSITSPREFSGLLHRAMEMVKAEFEPRTWNAFWRSAIENEPTAEIGAHLGITANSVRQAKSRVLRRLREELGELPE